MTIPYNASSITQYTKADTCLGYVISQESSVYRKSEKHEIFRKRNLFCAVHSNVQIDAKLDYMIRKVLLEMEHTSLQKQTAFITSHKNFHLSDTLSQDSKKMFATLKSSKFI